MGLIGLAFLTLTSVVRFQYVGGVLLRQTMVTSSPYGAGLPGVTFSCIRSNPDTIAPYSPGRSIRINIQGSTFGNFIFIPDDSVSSHNSLTWPLPPDVNATGVFQCQGTNDNRNASSVVYSIIHSYHRKFEPADGKLTKTVNKGESVTLAVVSVNNGSSPVWHRISNAGGIVDNDISQNLAYKLNLKADMVADGDLFVVTQRDASVDDNDFGMIRLIVRDCVAGKWDPPDCAGVCDLCYNGGVCDDETGDCICPPGFSGPNCLTACGKHKFGWDCKLECGAGYLIQSCTGTQFGLPDPYGNSCISGYHGRDCDEECPTGMFGAGCTQTCYCESGTCDGFTGECLGESGCSPGYSGSNCQIPEKCPAKYYGPECTSKCKCPNDESCDRDTGNCRSPAANVNIVLLSAIGGGVVVVIVCLCVACFVCWCARSRRRRTPRQRRTVNKEAESDQDAPQTPNDDQAEGHLKYSYAIGNRGWQLPSPVRAGGEPATQAYENENEGRNSYYAEAEDYENLNRGEQRIFYENTAENPYIERAM